MTAKHIIRNTFTLVLWAIGLQGAAFVYDTFDSELTHPVWDATYNWLPFALVVLVSSLAVTVFQAYMLQRQPKVYREPRYQARTLSAVR